MGTTITVRDYNRFTTGDCHILAKRIHRLTGWQLVAFDAGDGTPDCHVAVMMPDGRILDVEGATHPETWRQHWSEYTDSQVITTDRTALRAFGSPCYGHYSYRRAREIAPELLRLHTHPRRDTTSSETTSSYPPSGSRPRARRVRQSRSRY